MRRGSENKPQTVGLYPKKAIDSRKKEKYEIVIYFIFTFFLTTTFLINGHNAMQVSQAIDSQSIAHVF